MKEKPKNMSELERLEAQMREAMKKYKLTMYALIACIVLYLVCLFMVKNNWLVLACCVPMIVLAVINNKYVKQIKRLGGEIAQIRNVQKADGEAGMGVKDEKYGIIGDGIQESTSAPILANAKSLNELPKQYTVLDDIDLDGETLEHVVVSPTGVAVVADPALREKVQERLDGLGIENLPVIYLDPAMDIAAQAVEIQSMPDSVLSEQEIYKVLYNLTGLR